MDMTNQVQILDKAVSISQSTKIFGKGMNPTILPPAMGKILSQNRLFNLVMATSLEKGNIVIQTYKLLKISPGATSYSWGSGW